MISGSTVLMNGTTINPGGSRLTEIPYSLEDFIKLSLTIEGYYNMSKTWESCGLRVRVLTSYDGSNWDDTPYAEFDSPSNLSKHVRATVSIIPDPAYIRCQVINQNTNETAYDCRVIATYSKSG